MTKKTNPISPEASAQATSWMIRLQETPEDMVLQQQFTDWLDQPGNDDAWREIDMLTQLVAQAPSPRRNEWALFLEQTRAEAAPAISMPIPSSLVWEENQESRLSASIPNAKRAPNGPQRFRLAGLAIAASFLALLFGPGFLRDWQSDYSTDTAEIRFVRLADDTLITLAPESAIKVTYTSGARHVHLLAGEAFFEVTPNTERPFHVLANAVEVTVLGTGFTVHRGDEGARVGVEHGRIQVNHANAKNQSAAFLTAGQTLRMSWAGNAELGTLPISQIGAWRQNQLIAQDQPFGQIVDRLRRYFGGVILITDATLKEQPVTGVYNLEDPVRALYAIAQSQNASIRQITPWLLIVSPS